MKKISMRAIAAAGFLLWASVSASAATLYVNGTSGDDSRSRATASNPSTPWRTIGRAAWGSTNRSSPNAAEAAQAADIVVVAAGSYNFSGSLNNRFAVVYNPVNQGTSPTNAITFIANGSVVLTAPSTGSPVIGCSGRNYVVWQGPFSLNEVSISISPDTGSVVMHNATGCGLNGVTIDGDGLPGYTDNHTGVRVEVCQSCFVRNSTIHDVKHTNGNHNGSGVMLYNSDNTVIEHNHIYDVDNAVFIKGVFGVLDHQQGTIVRYNLMVDCDECITVSDSRNARIYQNVIRDSQIAVNLLGRESETFYHPNGDWFFNNTIDNMVFGCIYVQGGNFHEGVRVWNNITSGCEDHITREGTTFNNNGNIIDWEHNNYSTGGTFADDSSIGEFTFASWKTAFGHDQAAPASVQTNPRFANPVADDFRLCTAAGAPHASCVGASPALSLGVDLFDLDGDGSTTDVIPAGAYLTNNEVIGPPASTLPSAPLNLRITTP
jgi:hypothetical protein